MNTDKAVKDCPYNEPLHYDMDGCPACYNASGGKYVQLTQKYEDIEEVDA
jgi:hypothetical protein